MSTTTSDRPDVALLGAGIMSATLGTLLKELEPTLDVVMFETLDDCAQESSEAWNNAGTGHAANCELNYTPQRSDGTVPHQFFPGAQSHDWRKAVAGQRVQIIKPDPDHTGVLEFGTEQVGRAGHSIVALLGASPGASTAASIAVQVLEKCFADELTSGGWLDRLKSIIPTYGIDLKQDATATRETRARTASVLGIDQQTRATMPSLQTAGARG
jgi:L-2-hydroxyglutarate oxidase LhgO